MNVTEQRASETVAARIKQARTALGWSMLQLARRSGLGEDVIEAIENGRRRRGITVDELSALSVALEVPVAELMPPDPAYIVDGEVRKVRAALMRDLAQEQKLFDAACEEISRISRRMDKLKSEIARLEEGKVQITRELRDGQMLYRLHWLDLIPVE